MEEAITWTFYDFVSSEEVFSSLAPEMFVTRDTK